MFQSTLSAVVIIRLQASNVTWHRLLADDSSLCAGLGVLGELGIPGVFGILGEKFALLNISADNRCSAARILRALISLCPRQPERSNEVFIPVRITDRGPSRFCLGQELKMRTESSPHPDRSRVRARENVFDR